MEKYLIRFVQVHESFRKPEVEALATLAGVKVEFLFYDESSPFSTISLPSPAAARTIISRSILSKGIYELWGTGTDCTSLHASVRTRTSHLWPLYSQRSFKFTLDTYQGGKRTPEEKESLINDFRYLDFQGPIKMLEADEEFCIFEDYENGSLEPKRLFFGRWIAGSAREVVNTYDLKKRKYISTTSMDAELSLITANMALAAPGKLFYDPFVGTGSFCIAAAHFGATTWGSDIDGRSFRGKGGEKSLKGNMRQYGLEGKWLDAFVGDLTNSPVRKGAFLDGIICDPPYGVREGLKVLGSRNGKIEAVFIDGEPAHCRDGYVAPKRPYGFVSMLDDILEFATATLVGGGRLSLWMPTANNEDEELAIPGNQHLEIVSVCVQPFNKWSRRLLTYCRLPEGEVSESQPKKRDEPRIANADDLNAFRRKYFQGFKPPPATNGEGKKKPDIDLDRNGRPENEEP